MSDMFKEVDAAAQILRDGGVIAYPTEAVWGLGCDPHNLAALEALFKIKQRDPAKAVLLVGASIEQAAPWLQQLPLACRKKVEASWPGPVTWIVPNTPKFNDVLTGGRDTVAIRVSAHPVVKALCEQFGGLVVSTSANISGEQALMTEADVKRTFSKKLDYVLSGRLGGNAKPSEIFDALTGRKLR